MSHSLKQFQRCTNCIKELVTCGGEIDEEENMNYNKRQCDVLNYGEHNNKDVVTIMRTLSKPNGCCSCSGITVQSCLPETLDPENHNSSINQESDGISIEHGSEVRHYKNFNPILQFPPINNENTITTEHNKVKNEVISSSCDFNISYPLPGEKLCKDNIWVCIPGRLRQMRKVNIEPVKTLEVDKMKEQLLCRPADGLGQNWFQLNIGRKNRCLEDMYFINRPFQQKQFDYSNVKQQNDDDLIIYQFDVSNSGGPRFVKNLNPCFGVLPFVESECNNSNGVQEAASTSSQGQGQSLKGRVIRVEGDGRCLFRSLVTCLCGDLQTARRDDFGCALRRDVADYETSMADVLRAKVVKLMEDNAHYYGQLERVVINADQPMPPGYKHFRERLSDMTLTSTMPGDLELNAVSAVLEKQVLVVDTKLRPIVVYGKDRFPQSKMLTVRYTRLGPDVGHYDGVILDRVYDFGGPSCTGTRATKEDDGGKPDNYYAAAGVLDYFTNFVSNLKTPKDGTDADEYKDVSKADFGAQCPSEKDLTLANGVNLNYPCAFPTGMTRYDIKDKNFVGNDKNVNKCQKSTSAESNGEQEHCEAEKKRRKAEYEMERGHVLEYDSSDVWSGDEDLLDEWDDDTVFYVIQNLNQNSDLIKDTDLFCVPDSRVKENGSMKELVSARPPKKRLVLAQIIEKTYKNCSINSKKESNRRKRKFKTGKHEGSRCIKRRKIYFKGGQGMSLRASSLPKNTNVRRFRTKARQCRHVTRIAGSKSYPRRRVKSSRRGRMSRGKRSRQVVTKRKQINSNHHRVGGVSNAQRRLRNEFSERVGVGVAHDTFRKGKRRRNRKARDASSPPRLASLYSRRLSRKRSSGARKQFTVGRKIISERRQRLPLRNVQDVCQQTPSGLNPIGCRTCFVCCKTILSSCHFLSVCILCGRSAHGECVDPSRKDHGGHYSLCEYCVPDLG